MVGLPGTKLFEQQWTGLRFDTGSRQWHGARPSVDRAGYNVVEDKRPKKPPVADDVDVEVEPAEEEAEEDVLEDASELEDDADAIPEEIEVEPETDEAER